MISFLKPVELSQTNQRQDRHDDDHQTYEINNATHVQNSCSCCQQDATALTYNVRPSATFRPLADYSRLPLMSLTELPAISRPPNGKVMVVLMTTGS